jgi:hypothetical protein
MILNSPRDFAELTARWTALLIFTAQGAGRSRALRSCCALRRLALVRPPAHVLPISHHRS